MTISVGNYTFEGPYTSTNPIEDRSGVYAVHCYRNEKYYLKDVGESATVKSRLDNHERRDCWARECQQGALRYSVRYTPNLQQQGRMEIEQEIREQFDPPCGKT